MKTLTKIEIVVSTILTVMVVGTVSYHYLEGWSYTDSFYFTGITMTTIGYGDLYPTSPMSKIFTVFFAFAGVGVSLFALSVFSTIYFEKREEVMGNHIRKGLLKTMNTYSRTHKKLRKALNLHKKRK